MDMCGLDSDTAKRLAGDKVRILQCAFQCSEFSSFIVINNCVLVLMYLPPNTEMTQATGDIGTQWILDLCSGIVKESYIPEDWKSTVVLPIYKGKGIQWSVDLTEELNCWNKL